MRLRKIISGGQIGADIAGLKAAKKMGLETGGVAPHGWKTLEGPKPELGTDYDLIEHHDSGYPARTFANVKMADATLRFAVRWDTPGEACTWRAIKHYDKPYCDVWLPIGDAQGRTHSLGRFYIAKGPEFSEYYDGELDVYRVADWLKLCEAETLNIAGNAKHFIEQDVYNWVVSLIGLMMYD